MEHGSTIEGSAITETGTASDSATANAKSEAPTVVAKEYRKVGGARLHAACGARTATLELLTGPRGRKVLHTVILEASDQRGFMHGSRSATATADAWLSERGMVAESWGGDSLKGLTVTVKRSDAPAAVPVAAAPEHTVEDARRAAEEWPGAMECRSVGQRYEGESSASALLSDLAVCGERFPLRWEAQPEGAGGYVVTLPTGRAAGTWGDVTRAAIGHVIEHRPGSVVAAAAERERSHAIRSEFAADAAERDTAALVQLSLVGRLSHEVDTLARRLLDTGVLREEQCDALHQVQGDVRRAVKHAMGAHGSRRYGWWDDVRSAAASVMRAARRLGVKVPSAAEITADVAEDGGRWTSPERSTPSEFLLSITRPESGGAAANAPSPDAPGDATPDATADTGGDDAAQVVQAQEAAAAALAVFDEAATDAPRNLGSLGRKALAHGWEVGPWFDGSRWHLVMTGLFLATDTRGSSGMVDTVAEAVWCGGKWESGRVSHSGRGISQLAGSRPHEYGYRELGTFVTVDWLMPVDREGERQRRTAEGRPADYWLERAGEASGRASEQCARATVAMDAVTARRGEAAWVADAEREGAGHYQAAHRLAVRCREMVERLAFEVSDADALGVVPDARRALEVSERAGALVLAVQQEAEQIERAVLKAEAAAVFAPLLAAEQVAQDARDVERLAEAPGMTLETFLERVREVRLEKVREVSAWHEFEGAPREQWGAIFDAACGARLYTLTAEGDVEDANERPLYLALYELAGAAGYEEEAAAGRALYEPRARRSFGATREAANAAWKALTGERLASLSMTSPWGDVVTLDAMVRDGRAPAGAEAAALRERLLVEVAYWDRREARNAARDVWDKWQARLNQACGSVNVSARLAALDAGCGPAETYRRELAAGWARRHWYKAAHPCPVVRVEGYRTIVEPGPVDEGAVRMLAQWAAEEWAAAGSAPTGETVPGGVWRGRRWWSNAPKDLARSVEQHAALPADERAELARDAVERAERDAGGWLASVMPGATLQPAVYQVDGVPETDDAPGASRPPMRCVAVREGCQAWKWSAAQRTRTRMGVDHLSMLCANCGAEHSGANVSGEAEEIEWLARAGYEFAGLFVGGVAPVRKMGERQPSPSEGRVTRDGVSTIVPARSAAAVVEAPEAPEADDVPKAYDAAAVARQQQWERLERLTYAAWWVRAVPADPALMSVPAPVCGETVHPDAPQIETAYGHRYRIERNGRLKKPFMVKAHGGIKVGAAADREGAWAAMREHSEAEMLTAVDDHVQRAQVGAPQGPPDEAWETTYGGWQAYRVERFGARYAVWEGPGYGHDPKTRRLAGIVDSRPAANQLVKDAYDATRARLAELAERDRQARQAAQLAEQEAAERQAREAEVLAAREAAELAAAAENDAPEPHQAAPVVVLPFPPAPPALEVDPFESLTATLDRLAQQWEKATA